MKTWWHLDVNWVTFFSNYKKHPSDSTSYVRIPSCHGPYQASEVKTVNFIDHRRLKINKHMFFWNCGGKNKMFQLNKLEGKHHYIPPNYGKHWSESIRGFLNESTRIMMFRECISSIWTSAPFYKWPWWSMIWPLYNVIIYHRILYRFDIGLNDI